MTTLLAEQPLLLSLMLGVLGAGLLYGWLQTGRRSVAIGGLVCLALIPLAWFVASRWETDRERIRRVIYETAEAVEANDYDAAVSIIGNTELRRRAESELRRYEFLEAEVTRIRRIEFIERAVPAEADVELLAKVTVNLPSRQLQETPILRRLLLTFRKEDGRWQVISYRHGPPVGGTGAFSAPPQR